MSDFPPDKSKYKHDYTWYIKRFGEDIGLRGPGEDDQHWRGRVAKAEQLCAIAAYYLAHPEYDWYGREILVEAMVSAAARVLDQRPFTPEEDEPLYRAVSHAMGDPYDRDIIGFEWVEAGDVDDDLALAPWLRARFPGWTPPPSVWSTM